MILRFKALSEPGQVLAEQEAAAEGGVRLGV